MTDGRAKRTVAAPVVRSTEGLRVSARKEAMAFQRAR